MKSIENALAELGLDAGLHDLCSIEAAQDHEARVLPAVARAFEIMQRAAVRDGVAIVAVSGYRSPARQAEIWNAKFDAACAQGLSPVEALASNLVYSAPPGWSRHHWGTDIDLVSASMAEAPQLEASDWEEGGRCYEAGCWLESHAAIFGFLKPYDRDHGGFASEPWHFSFAPAAIGFLPRMRRIPWDSLVRSSSYLGAGILLNTIEADFIRFVLGIQPRLRVAVSR